MHDERGGIAVGFFAAIGVIVVLLVIFGAACFNSAGASPRHISGHPSYDQECDENNDCYSQDNGSSYDNYDRNRNRNRNRGAFSPGPFDRSPVDIHDNQVCISPDCSGNKKEEKPPQQKASLACLIPVPYHCDPKPESQGPGPRYSLVW